MKIRLYKPTDYPQLREWWSRFDQGIPTPAMLPADTTFIAEKGNEIQAAITLYLTNSKAFAIADNFIANPDIDICDRRYAVRALLAEMEGYATQLGIQSIFAMSTKPKLTERYEGYGYKATHRSITTLSKRLGDAPCPLLQ